MIDLLIIGCGISGIVTAKNAKDNNLNYIILEKQSNFGGCWRNKAFTNTKLQTHKKYYQFLDHKIVTENDYPYCYELLDYYQSYIKKHDLKIQYNSEVIKCYKESEWITEFKINNKKMEIKSRYLAICSGLFNIPYKPYSKILHSSDLIKQDFSIFSNKTIAIIGNGASSSDIIHNLIINGNCKKIYLIYRKNKWYVKRYIFGMSISIIISKYVLKLASYINNRLFITIFSLILRIFFGNNLENPLERVKYNNLIADDNILDYIKSKKVILIRDKILNIDNKITTTNHSINYDFAIQCTGYKFSIPFLNINQPLYNYLYIYNKNYPNCGFIGFNPSYNWIEVSTYQSLWFINFIKNKIKLPNKDMDIYINKKKKEKNKLKLEYQDLTYESLDYIQTLKKQIRINQ